MNVLEVIEQRPEIEDDLWETYQGNGGRSILMFVQMPVLVPTDENNDTNGSNSGGSNFTYRNATEDDVENATTVGIYDYFGAYSIDGSIYSGNQYETYGCLFEAIVLDPPAYAVETTLSSW